MARNDIRPFRSVQGGSDLMRGFPQAASAAFREGEPVVMTAGALAEATDDPPVVTGIAATRAVDAFGTSFATGTMATVVVGVPTQQFVCFNFATDGAGTTATPTQANAIGALAGLTLDGSGNWWVDTGCANLLVQIDEVVDSTGRNITNPTNLPGSGFGVVFHFI